MLAFLESQVDQRRASLPYGISVKPFPPSWSDARQAATLTPIFQPAIRREICVKAVVFDWDGTLVDSQRAYLDSWRIALAAAGHEITSADLQYAAGRAFPDVLHHFSTQLSVDPKKVEHEFRKDFPSRVQAEIVRFPDAVTCAQELQKSGIDLAIATQTPRAEFDRALAATGLDGLITTTVCRTEVARPKPAPDLYLEVCRRLEREPADCLAIEDSPVGAASARKAGLFVVGIARSAQAVQSLNDAANTVVETLDSGMILRFCET